MAIVVVDTTVLIDHLRGHAAAVACLDGVNLRGDELWSVPVVRTEVLAGIRAPESAAMQILFGALRWLDVTTELADAAGELAARYRRSHSGIDIVDYLVAAAAQRLDATLLTRNVRHFPMFEGLRPAYA